MLSQDPSARTINEDHILRENLDGVDTDIDDVSSHDSDSTDVNTRQLDEQPFDIDKSILDIAHIRNNVFGQEQTVKRVKAIPKMEEEDIVKKNFKRFQKLVE